MSDTGFCGIRIPLWFPLPPVLLVFPPPFPLLPFPLLPLSPLSFFFSDFADASGGLAASVSVSSPPYGIIGRSLGYSFRRETTLEVCRMLPLGTGELKSFPGSFFDLCKVLHLWSRYLFHCGIDFLTS